MTARGARYEATQKGEKHYMPEKPCRRGHLALKVTATGTCVECRKMLDKVRYDANPEKAIAHSKTHYHKNAEKLRAKRRKQYAETGHLERGAAVQRSREWRKNNPGHRNALKAKYKAATIQATPIWAEDQRDMIKAKYQLAAMLSKETGVVHHVDHIIPLRNELVCGLHVFENLRVITAEANMRKNNKFEVI